MTLKPEDPAVLPLSDPAYLATFHDRTFPELYRYAYYRVGDPASAEDLASEAFTRLLEAVRSGRGPRSHLRGWLFGTLRHLVDDHHRRTFRSPREPLGPETVDPGADVHLQIEDRELAARLHRALRRLTPEQQHVLALRFGGEHSVEETAGLMQRNPNAVKALQHRALRALRRHLKEHRR